ncbi:MAG: hypothetical protein EOO38_13880, partial [Cytophagaceae bacterium]
MKLQPVVTRIQVINAKPHKILVSSAHADLPEDKDWSNARIADTSDSENAIIWSFSFDCITKGERAFAWSSTSQDRRWAFDIEIHGLGAEYDGKEVEIMLAEADTYPSRYKPAAIGFATSDRITINSDFAVFRVSGNGGSPIGFFGKYKIWIHVVNQPEDATSPKTWVATHEMPVEAYYLSAPELPDTFKDGIPLLLLRMFTLPHETRLHDDSTETWIRHVTEICFGSRKPFDGRPSQTEDHWLIYNSMDGGSSSFSAKYGMSGLNISAWLDAYRNWKTHNVFTKINCYDQAAIAEVALCLGISHKQIHWEYNQVYGFINGGLVGWGHVNNPY